ncbi:MAG: uroporphyrinogen-III C-methyltransferase [Hyphomicrobium sp.]
MTIHTKVKQDALHPVSLIGCGPGDPELLTLRALERIKKADVLVVDRLVGEDITCLSQQEALIIPVGKDPRSTSTPQEEINRILVREALKGQRVVRLKGGDGFVFGRAAEEISAIRAAGLKVEIVPGITAAHACAASIVLPLTMRETIRQFSLVTGAVSDGPNNTLDWETLAHSHHAFAIYMGVRNAAFIRQKLLQVGASPSLSIVIVENGCKKNELSVATTLVDMTAAIEAFEIKGPAILFGGLSWEDSKLSMPDKVHVFNSPSKCASEAITMYQRTNEF